MKTDLIGKKTARLLEALEGKNLTSEHYQIIAHPDVYDRTDPEEELLKLHSRGFTSMKFGTGGRYLHTLNEKGQRVLDDYRSSN